MCGDFNAKRGELTMECEGIPLQNVTDVMKKCQEEALADFPRRCKYGSSEWEAGNGRLRLAFWKG